MFVWWWGPLCNSCKYFTLPPRRPGWNPIHRHLIITSSIPRPSSSCSSSLLYPYFSLWFIQAYKQTHRTYISTGTAAPLQREREREGGRSPRQQETTQILLCFVLLVWSNSNLWPSRTLLCHTQKESKGVRPEPQSTISIPTLFPIATLRAPPTSKKY